MHTYVHTCMGLCKCELIYYMHTYLLYNAEPGRVKNVSLTCSVMDLINQCTVTWNVSLYIYALCLLYYYCRLIVCNQLPIILFNYKVITNLYMHVRTYVCICTSAATLLRVCLVTYIIFFISIRQILNCYVFPSCREQLI